MQTARYAASRRGRAAVHSKRERVHSDRGYEKGSDVVDDGEVSAP